MSSAVNRFAALVSFFCLASSALVLAEPKLSISVSPTELTLYGGEAQIEKITAYGTGPALVGPSDDECDRKHVVNVVGGKSEHEGGALVTSSTYTLFLQAKREAAECTITFAVDTLGHGRVAQTMHVRVLAPPKVSITTSPDRMQLSSSHPVERLTVTAHGASSVDRLSNTCGGANPIASVISDTKSSSGGPGNRSVTWKLDVLGKHRGDCTMTFWSQDARANVDIHVL